METAKANVALSEAVLKQAENQKSAGTGTGIEITRARVQLANDRQRLLVARECAAQRAAATAARDRTAAGYGTGADGQARADAPVDAMTIEQAKAKALEERPDYQAQRERGGERAGFRRTR